METIQIAKILKPQGVKGEMKLEVLINDNAFFKSLNNVYIDNKCFEVVSCCIRQGFGYLTIKGVIDRNQAESFRNKIVYVDRKDGPKLNIDEYLTQDMIGLNVIDENGKNYGKVISIEQYGAADVYIVHGKYGAISFPFIKNLVINVDLNNKTLFVDSKTLEEVKV